MWQLAASQSHVCDALHTVQTVRSFERVSVTPSTETLNHSHIVYALLFFMLGWCEGRINVVLLESCWIVLHTRPTLATNFLNDRLNLTSPRWLFGFFLLFFFFPPTPICMFAPSMSSPSLFSWSSPATSRFLLTPPVSLFGSAIDTFLGSVVDLEFELTEMLPLTLDTEFGSTSVKAVDFFEVLALA